MDDVCRIPHLISIVSAKGHELPLDDRLRHDPKAVFGIVDMGQVLNHMRDGVPAVLKSERSAQHGPQNIVYFCTPEFVAKCVVKDTIYLLTAVYAPDFIYHHLPNWQSVRVCPARWQVLASGSHANASTGQTGYKLIEQRFKAHLAYLDHPDTVQEPFLTPAQQAYLELLHEHIELARQVETDRAHNRPLVVFNNMEATDAERLVRSIYTFQLAEANPFAVNDFIWVGWEGLNPAGHKEQGRVKTTENRRVTVKFERQVDIAELRCPGVMGFAFYDIQQRIQEQALESLRDGRALNRNLLTNIVDNQYAPYPMPAHPTTGPSEDASQNRAYNYALAVEDMLLIWGPPGTGKTTTITMLAKALADQSQKVLITSKSNPAVDNVLKALKKVKDLRIVRIGHEDRVTHDVKPLLIDNQARKLQADIVSATNEPFQHLEKMVTGWPSIQANISRLQALAPLWSQHLQQQENSQNRLRVEQIAVCKQHKVDLHRQETRARQGYQRAVSAIRKANQSVDLLEWLLRRRNWPVVGLVVTAISGWLATRATRNYRQAEQAQVAYMRLVHRYKMAVTRYYATASTTPAVLAAKEEFQAAILTVEKLAEAAGDEVSQLQSVLANASIPVPSSSPATPTALLNYLDRVLSLKPILDCRYQLLAEWRECLEERRQALYLALIRSAQVVGATCIGIATDRTFRKLEFDTVIADEAGQIQAFDLLVPLVRARRAILVGDHKQLPPVVDEEVKALLDEDNEESINLLQQSLFERLSGSIPSTHKVMLQTQYRMPAEIADFVSPIFYEGKYYTATPWQLPPADLFFSRPICFIDTEHKPQYRECKGRGETTGRFNPGEAELLSRIAAAYLDQGHSSIGIIIPYKLQVAEVQRALRKRCPDLADDVLSGMVASVDAFQGNQRKIILFGFTRSNNWGSVGFLNELRRLNVTITRAERQLILVGDSHTLTRATDQEFQDFARRLLAHISEVGQYLTVPQLEELLHAKGY
jgi:energy-coupling factor transporter ATP-binding protein EcfA2